MKLNNLSRLTALLLAVMMLGMASAGAETSFNLGDVTYDTLKQADAAAAMIADNKCTLCTETLTNLGLLTWPVDDFDCLHEHLASMKSTEAYQMLYDLDLGTMAEYTLSQAYIKAHNSHVDETDDDHLDAVICYGLDCYKNPPSAPGPSHVHVLLDDGTVDTANSCPWYQATLYVPSTSITTTPDVSTPDELAGLTEVILSFTATDATTYTWQRSADPDAESPVWENIATGESYTLSITPEALTYAYRCVATDADGNVTEASAVLYLGGETFFEWVNSTETNDDGTTTDIRTWMLLDGNTVEYILAAYEAYVKGIALAEAIHVTAGDTADTYILLELLGLTTLADIDSEGNVIDTRYHITVATYKDGVITALTTSDTTATD